MNGHHCNILIATCIDFRFQKYIDKWINENFDSGTFDRVAIAGGVFDLDYILKQAEISKRLHHIHKIVLINHEDCGAYGEKGTTKKHSDDLINAAETIKAKYSDVETDLYYLHFDGTFEKIS